MINRINTKFIPLDKYWVIRMGVLDMINGYTDIAFFLNKQKDLGGDLLALKHASKSWSSGLPVDIGESGTLYRFLQFTSWKLDLNKKFIKQGTLKHRKVCTDSHIINWKLKKLLTLDGGTSQWASASILLGNTEKLKNPPYFIKVTYEAIKHWKSSRRNNKSWEPKFDEVLLRQSQYFVNRLNSKKSMFVPSNPDDYCFARVFGIVSKRYGERKWPMLRHHESDRLEEMEKFMREAQKGQLIKSKDHRVIQAIAMWGVINSKHVRFKYLKSVNKSWPQFWDFLDFYSKK